MRIGMSSVAYEFTDESFSEMIKNGITDMELSRSQEEHDVTDYNAVKRLADKHGVNLWSFHLPFTKLDIAAEDKDERWGVVKYWESLMDRSSDTGVDKYVLHPSWVRREYTPEERAEMMKRSMECLDYLAERAYKQGAVIAVENLPSHTGCLGKDSDEILKLVSANDKLRVCFDTNHLIEEDAGRFLERVGSKIITLHVSDYDYVREKHWFPGEGKVDFHKLYKQICDIGYDKVWMYELRLGEVEAVGRNKKLTIADFARNADEIFNGKPLTRIF